MKYRLFKILGAVFAVWLTADMLCSCVGPDFTPDYFGMQKSEDEDTPPSETKKPEDTVSEALTVTKLLTGEDGRQIEISIPEGRLLEVGNGTFIAKSETDIGPKFASVAKFKITNTGNSTINLDIPRDLPPFLITSMNELKLKLAPKQFLIITVTFGPTGSNAGKAETISKTLKIGVTEYQLRGIALERTGIATVNTIDNSGKITTSAVESVIFPSATLSSHPLRRFFKCDSIKCGDNSRATNCMNCLDNTAGDCQLLPINREGLPVDAVDSSCKPITRDTTPQSEINLTNVDVSDVQKKIIEIINSGPEPLIIDSISIKDTDESGSKDEFSIDQKAIFIAESFDEIKQRVFDSFNNDTRLEAARFPIVLPPYDPPATNTRVFAVVAYHPSNIVGANGIAAAAGSSAKDEATLLIKADDNRREIHLIGETTIKEVPELQIFVKTSTGLRPIANGEELPFKGVTANTTNLAEPLFMKLSDSATETLRITGINLQGTNFEWLDTTEKIESKPPETRCTIPVFDNQGRQINVLTSLSPVSLNPKGFDLSPGVYTTDNMPLFGCINFTKDPSVSSKQTTFRSTINIGAQTITASGQPALNPDGSAREMTFSFNILGVIDPIKGKIILRLTQTMAAVMNPDYPGISSVASDDEMNILIKDGLANESDKSVFIMPIMLDPFDEETIYNLDGSVATTPGDGVTAIFYPIDTRAVPTKYNDPLLPDYTSLIHDSLLPEGQQGLFTGFPNLPANFRTEALKIFTGSLSYPGPVAPPEKRPNSPSECEIIDPCTPEGQRKLGEGTNDPSYKGVCAFFYTSGGDYNTSPALHYPTENPPGTRRDMCQDREKPYDLRSIKGKYSLDGKIEFYNAGLFFQGPTYFHNPWSPLGSAAKPLDELFQLTFTTEPLLPISDTKTVDRLPDKRIDLAKGEYRINLNDPSSSLAKLCKGNVKNRYIHGEYLSTWKYIAPLLKKDKEGTISAGCPEEDNNFTGGIAYLSGRRVDQEKGYVTFVTAGKFSSSEGLTFAFKDVMLFLILNGWLCDPLGPEDQQEGSHCYDKVFNYRDAESQFSIVGGMK